MGCEALAPWAGDYWGTAVTGLQVQRLLDSVQGSQPQVGAIACWNDGGYGHVAVVTAVQSTTSIQVSESNYNGIRVLEITVVGSTQQQLKVL